MAKRILPTAERLRELLVYDESSGKLFWRERCESGFSSLGRCIAWNERYAGKEALTSVNGSGYRHGYVDYVTVIAHRVAWAIFHGDWPDSDIDHRSTDKLDNRMSNLRKATNAENMRNKRARRDNKCGLKGVCWNTSNKKWKAQISIDGKVMYLGLFDNAESAHSAYCAAAEKLHGEFARTE